MSRIQSSVKRYPLIGQAELMRRMFNGDDLSQTAAQLINLANTDPNNAEALLDLSMVLILRGSRDVGLATQRQALKIKQHYQLPNSQPQSVPSLSKLNDIDPSTIAHGQFRLLIIKTPGDFMANTPVEFLVETPEINVDVLYISPELDPPKRLAYDLIFVAISEMESNLAALKMTDGLLKTWRIPHINHPDEIPLLARDRACELMDTVPGVYMPQNIRVSRQNLKDIAELQLQLRELLMQDRFPLLVRPVDTHAGTGLQKITCHEEIPEYLSRFSENEFFLAPFVDYRSTDGQFRKYRIVFISGEPFLCHMAISKDWMVHYLNADMTGEQLKRDEEANNMLSFSKHLGRRQKTALAGIAETIDLDYFGIDCGETADGQLLIFELANAMVVHDMDPVNMFPYKKPVMHQVYNKFQDMLYDKGGLNTLSMIPEL